MADELKSYKNVFDETVTTASLVSDMIAKQQSKVQAGESNITDMNVGSEVRNLLEVSSTGIYRLLSENNQLGKMLFLKYASNQFIDDKAYEVGLTRKRGTAANGMVTFSISTPLTSNYTIYAGTRILSSVTGNSYFLQDDVTIKSSETWVNGLVVAEVTGEEYNCGAGELTAFETGQNLRNDLSVTNDAAFENGSDMETDESFRKRVLDAMRGGTFGRVGYYEANCENVDGVHDVRFVNPSVLNSISRGRHSILNSKNEKVECNECTAVCLVNISSGASNTKENILSSVNDFLINQHNIILGHGFHVQSANVNKLKFKISYYGTKTVSETEVKKCLDALFEGGTYDGVESITYEGYDIGANITKFEIMNALENIEGITRIESIKILLWHENLSVIKQLTNWINTNKLYGYSTQNPFVYNNILDFPDYDDEEYTSSSPVPAWTKVGTWGTSSKPLYELCVNDCYFYKYKDNSTSGDNNTGEYGDDAYWLWGERNFNTIGSNIDTVVKLGELDDDDNGGHIVELHKLSG